MAVLASRRKIKRINATRKAADPSQNGFFARVFA
jgi:hypothetical protein